MAILLAVLAANASQQAVILRGFFGMLAANEKGKQWPNRLGALNWRHMSRTVPSFKTEGHYDSNFNEH